ncbi:MAG: DUF1007 family protein [Alphaproteobacteria bacterium]
MADRGWGRMALGAAVLGLSVLASDPAAAHPHGWIDVRSALVFDDRGRAVALRQVWLFDAFYSAFAVEGLDQDGDGKPDQAGLAALLRENMTNLQAYDYFTRVESGGAPVAFAPVNEMSSRMRGDRLEMRFTIAFAAPAEADGDGLTYAIFDPTYYIEMLHVDADAVQLVDAPEGCAFLLVEPGPDPEAIALAAMLDRTESGGDDLGAQFAETVTVRCAAR